ncbi:hypothetical protein [Enterobacter sp. Bisph1]|uniref:hypothetical protein n=1 Tax=Enterobacter sp. Bisph1 TaxID=1274399 RepID=UPI00057BD3C5|nr:hypothetical protein [Enterobacter sp. Bisph1]
MSADFILFSYSWPTQSAINLFLERHEFQVIKIYQDEQKLLETLHQNTSTALIFDAPAHRKILLIAAIATTSRLRTVFFTTRKININDRAVADFYFEEKNCFTHSELIAMSREDIFRAMKVERSPVYLSPGIMRPRIMNLLYDGKALYKEIQNKIYHKLYLIGATTNEINTLRLLIAGLSIQTIAQMKGVQLKTIYAYKAQLAQKVEHSTSSRELLRVLSVGEKNQDNEYLNHLYNTRCNSETSLCDVCPLYQFCYEPEAARCSTACNECFK